MEFLSTCKYEHYSYSLEKFQHFSVPSFSGYLHQWGTLVAQFILTCSFFMCFICTFCSYFCFPFEKNSLFRLLSLQNLLSVAVLWNCSRFLVGRMRLDAWPDMTTRTSQRWTPWGSFSGWPAARRRHCRRRKRRQQGGGTWGEGHRALPLLPPWTEKGKIERWLCKVAQLAPIYRLSRGKTRTPFR